MKISNLLKGALAAALLATGFSAAQAEERVLWLSIGDGLGNSSAVARQNAIDNAIDFATDNGFNAISVLARYRSNAFYIPNRNFDTYTNPEPRAYNDGFDELQYTIDNARAEGLRVYAAWSAFLVTDGSNTYPSHLDPNWRMWIYQGSSPASSYDPDTGFPRAMVTSDPNGSSGLWVDPGIPAVRDYTVEVLLDLVENYDIDGVVLDRIRFPQDSGNRFGHSYGYTPGALSAYGLTNPPPGDSDFIEARRDAITDFLSEASAAVYDVKPWVIVGATPVIFGESTNSTYNFVYQYVPDWSSAPNPNHTTGLGAVDIIMPQYYRDGDSFSNINAMNAMRPDVANMSHQPLFRSFTITSTLAEHNAQSICAAQQAGDDGFGFFSVLELGTIIDDINSTTTPCGDDLVTQPAPANIEYDFKVGYDATVPGSPLSPVAVTGLLPGRIMVFWADATNAEAYHVYRSTSSPVAEVYANLLTPKPIRATTFYDSGLEDGVMYHYRIVPVSSWNVRGPGAEASAVAEVPTEIVQSRPGPSHAGGPGANVSTLYQETGSFSDSSVVSSATGVQDFGSRFTTTIGATGSFSPPISTAGFYEVEVTLHPAVSHNANADFEINGTHQTLNGQIFLNGPAIGHAWTSLNSSPIYLTDGSSPFDDFVRFENLDGDDFSTARMNMDSVRFRLIESFPLSRSVEEGAEVTVTAPTRAGGTIAVTFFDVTSDGSLLIDEFYSNANSADLDTASLIDQSFLIENPSAGIVFDDATVVLTYDPNQLNGLSNDSDDLNAVFAVDGSDNVTKYDGASVSFDYGANTVTVTGVDSFSTWYIGDTNADATSIRDWQLMDN